MQMLVDDIGDVTISNDGATILSLLEVEHPAAKVRRATPRVQLVHVWRAECVQHAEARWHARERRRKKGGGMCLRADRAAT